MSDVINIRAKRALHAKRSEVVDNSAAFPAEMVDTLNRKYNGRSIGMDFNAAKPVRSGLHIPVRNLCRLPAGIVVPVQKSERTLPHEGPVSVRLATGYRVVIRWNLSQKHVLYEEERR